jgi:hypothetical protein
MSIQIFKQLPDEIILEISKYLDNISYRNGKYIYKIPKNDFRYEIITKIKSPLVFRNNRDQYPYVTYLISLNYNNGYGCILYYYFNEITKCTDFEIKNYIIGNVRCTWKPTLYEKLNEKYIIDENCICHKN